MGSRYLGHQAAVRTAQGPIKDPISKLDLVLDAIATPSHRPQLACRESLFFFFYTDIAAKMADSVGMLHVTITIRTLFEGGG